MNRFNGRTVKAMFTDLRNLMRNFSAF